MKNKCKHPVEKQKIWRVWTTFFNQNNVERASTEIVLECECGNRHCISSEIGDDNPI